MPLGKHTYNTDLDLGGCFTTQKVAALFLIRPYIDLGTLLCDLSEGLYWDRNAPLCHTTANTMSFTVFARTSLQGLLKIT